MFMQCSLTIIWTLLFVSREHKNTIQMPLNKVSFLLTSTSFNYSHCHLFLQVLAKFSFKLMNFIKPWKKEGKEYVCKKDYKMYFWPILSKAKENASFYVSFFLFSKLNIKEYVILFLSWCFLQDGILSWYRRSCTYDGTIFVDVTLHLGPQEKGQIWQIMWMSWPVDWIMTSTDPNTWYLKHHTHPYSNGLVPHRDGITCIMWCMLKYSLIILVTPLQ